MAINAAADKQAFTAFRNAMSQSGDDLAKHFTDAELGSLLAALRQKHQPIAQYLGADAGIDLMNKDAEISAFIVNAFVEAGRPILTIHDSYIVSFGDDARLNDAMRQGFEEVTGIRNIHLKREGLGFHRLLASRSSSSSLYEADKVCLEETVNQQRSAGYIRRMELFYSH